MKEIRHIGVVGQGKMGKSIFYYLNDFDFSLSWLVSSEEGRDESAKSFLKKTKFSLQAGILSEEAYASKLGRTIITTNITDLKQCDLIIEAIPEDIGLKKSFFESLEKAVNSDCIFSTNSSSILPSELVPSEGRKERFCGLHFFFPVVMKTIVEMIITQSTSSETKELLHKFLLKINKKAFVQEEADAFILNRLFLDFQAGSYQVYLEGKLGYREIDELVKQNMFPVGVFEFFDHVGIDVMLSSIKAYTKEFTDKTFYFPLIKKMEEMVRLNRLGVKTKQGFYNYHPLEEEKLKSGNNHTSKEIADYKQMIIGRLRDYFLNSAELVIRKGLVSREDLAFAIHDYMGMDEDPFLFKKTSS